MAKIFRPLLRRFGVWAAVLLSVLGLCSDYASANALSNPGFEVDAVFGAAPVPAPTGWTVTGNANTASDPNYPVLSGIGSLQLVGGGGFGVPVAFQTFPLSPGEIVDLQGYMLTESALPANATFGLLKIVFQDGAGADLPVGAADVLIGQAGPPANPGVEALPFLDSTSPTNQWIFSQARGIAPAGTAQVSLFGIFVDESPGTIYLDDLQAIIPEPTGVALAMVGLVGLVLRRSKSEVR